MAAEDDEIDRLFQLPLAEFTAARDALAKTAGKRGPEIKSLQKPNAAAWAVNQLYWRRRKTFDKLVTAAERLRVAHAGRLSGKPVDVALAETTHKVARKAAVEEARQLLQQAGDAASPATVAAVTDTLDTLPWSDPPGRLVRPLKPRGFEALAGLLPGGADAVKRLAPVVPINRGLSAAPATKAERAAEAEAKRREDATARRREMARVDRDLRAAQADERKAEAELAGARRQHDRASRTREEVEAELERARTAVQEAAAAVTAALAATRLATTERARLEARLADLEKQTDDDEKQGIV